MGKGLGLGNQVAISTRGCIIWQGCRFQHSTGTAARARGLALPARAHTSLSLSLSASAQFLFSVAAIGREEQRFNSVKHRYYVASLILHASIAEITAQLLSLSYVYLISSDDGAIIMIFCAD